MSDACFGAPEAVVYGDTYDPRRPPQPRHPVTGRFLAFDCEIDCQEHCAGLCGEWREEP